MVVPRGYKKVTDGGQEGGHYIHRRLRQRRRPLNKAGDGSEGGRYRKRMSVIGGCYRKRAAVSPVSFFQECGNNLGLLVTFAYA